MLWLVAVREHSCTALQLLPVSERSSFYTVQNTPCDLHCSILASLSDAMFVFGQAVLTQDYCV